MTNYQRSKLVIQQIKDGEWEGVYNSISEECYTIKRGDQRLWVANGGFSCKGYIPTIGNHVDLFGLVFRHWVYFHAKGVKKYCEKLNNSVDEWDKLNEKY